MSWPTQGQTNFDDPQQRFVWALRGLRFNGSPVIIPEPAAKELSEHLSRCGFVHIDQVAACPVGENPLRHLPAQEIHYQPPLKGQDHSMNTSGEWVDAETPIITESGMSLDEKQELIQQFREEGLID